MHSFAEASACDVTVLIVSPAVNDSGSSRAIWARIESLMHLEILTIRKCTRESVINHTC